MPRKQFRHRHFVAVTPVIHNPREPAGLARHVPWSLIAPLGVAGLVALLALAAGGSMTVRPREAAVAEASVLASDLLADTRLVPIPNALRPAGPEVAPTAPWRTSTSVSLQITEPGAVERIAAGFGPAERAPMRERLERARAAGVSRVPLASLMPAWARARLDTFAVGQDATTNGFWTALHFADDDRASQLHVGSGEAFDALLQRDFARVTARERFGDVVVLRDQRRRARHAVTRLLGDYVFEECGAGGLQMWRIAPLTQVRGEHPEVTSVEAWRRREPR